MTLRILNRALSTLLAHFAERFLPSYSPLKMFSRTQAIFPDVTEFTLLLLR